MSVKPPRRYKTHDELSVQEHLDLLQAGRRRGPGEPTRFETDEYRRYRSDALKAAGIDEDEGDEAT